MLRMRRARSVLIADQPFYGVIGMHLKLVEDSSCKTLWTDGVTLGFNPQFVKDCSERELRAVWCKEILHAALGHPWRSEGRDFATWAEACDYAVASLIAEAGYCLPGVYRSNEAYSGWCAEAIYRELKAEQRKRKAQPKPAPGESSAPEEGADKPGVDTSGDDDASSESGESSGGAEDQPNSWRNGLVGELRPAPTEQEAQAQQEALASAVEQAAMAQGDLPGGLQLALKLAKNARVNWKEVLWHFVQAAYVASDYSWSRPNPRYISMGLYIPRLQGTGTPPMTGAVDVSGSIVADPELANQFMSEMDAIVSECAPEEFTALYVDTKVQLHEKYYPGDSIEARHLPGGGGTSFVPAFEWVKRSGETPCCLVYLTDLEGTFPSEEPEYPVLWVVPDKTGKHCASPPKVPFGEVVVLPAFN